MAFSDNYRLRKIRVGIDGYTDSEFVLDAIGYSNVKGKIGINSIPTEESPEFYVQGDGYFTGVVTATTFFAGPTEITGGALADDLVVTTLQVNSLSTFTGVSTFLDDLYVGGTLYIDTIGNYVLENIDLDGTFTANQLSTGELETSINIFSSALTGPEIITIDPATIGDATGSVIVKGNLTVESNLDVSSGIVTASEFVGIGSQLTDITFRQLSDVSGNNLVAGPGGTQDYIVIYDATTDSFRFVNPQGYFGINADANPDPSIVDYGTY